MVLALSIPLADTWGMHGDVGVGWMIGMMLVMVLFWAVLILGIVWLVRGPYDGSGGRRRETPSEILNRRLAEGAISVDDYDERLKVIGHGTRRDPSSGGGSSPRAAAG